METTTATGALGVAKDATDWLQTAGGWAMFLIAAVVIYFLVKHILSQNTKLEAANTALAEREKAFRLEKEAAANSHKEEIARLHKEHRDELDEKDEKLFGLLDKTNDLMGAIQKLGSKQP